MKVFSLVILVGAISLTVKHASMAGPAWIVAVILGVGAWFPWGILNRERR